MFLINPQYASQLHKQRHKKHKIELYRGIIWAVSEDVMKRDHRPSAKDGHKEIIGRLLKMELKKS